MKKILVFLPFMLFVGCNWMDSGCDKCSCDAGCCQSKICSASVCDCECKK